MKRIFRITSRNFWWEFLAPDSSLRNKFATIVYVIGGTSGRKEMTEETVYDVVGALQRRARV